MALRKSGRYSSSYRLAKVIIISETQAALWKNVSFFTVMRLYGYGVVRLWGYNVMRLYGYGVMGRFHVPADLGMNPVCHLLHSKRPLMTRRKAVF